MASAARPCSTPSSVALPAASGHNQKGYRILADGPRVTIWNEYRHEKSDEDVAEIYPGGIHGTLAAMLKEAGFEVRTATLDEPEHGLPREVLDTTDVLLWWGHMAHDEVSDEVVEKVHERV